MENQVNENMGHLVVYLPKEEVTKQFSFICWLYCFICKIGTSIPYFIFFFVPLFSHDSWIPNNPAAHT